MRPDYDKKNRCSTSEWRKRIRKPNPFRIAVNMPVNGIGAMTAFPIANGDDEMDS
jgi:hypothetical protein